jgi:hypothetical protein
MSKKKKVDVQAAFPTAEIDDVRIFCHTCASYQPTHVKEHQVAWCRWKKNPKKEIWTDKNSNLDETCPGYGPGPIIVDEAWPANGDAK